DQPQSSHRGDVASQRWAAYAQARVFGGYGSLCAPCDPDPAAPGVFRSLVRSVAGIWKPRFKKRHHAVSIGLARVSCSAPGSPVGISRRGRLLSDAVGTIEYL